ncbi:MAG: hypothetical protein ACM3UL_03050 [Ignavibacteria bacterium]
MVPGFRFRMLSADTGLEGLIKQAIVLYNRTHSPNATAQQISLTPPFLVVQFKGSFCTGCGTFEITDSFSSQVKILSGGKVVLKHDKTTQTNSNTIQTTYIIKTK